MKSILHLLWVSILFPKQKHVQRVIKNLKGLQKGGEKNEAIYDTQSCSLRQWALTIVPGMTLNCPNSQ